MHLINQADLPATLITKERPQSTPKKRSPSQNTFDPELSQHPIFQWREDDILSGLVQSLEDLIRIEPNPKVLSTFSGKFQNHIHDIIFSGKKIKELSDSQIFGRSTQKGACAKPMIEPDSYFRCLDCEKNPELQSSLCCDCFDKSNHEGHRVCQLRLEQGLNALCDCGDSEVFNPEGFCSEHRSVQLTTKELMQQFPSIIFERYQLVVKKAFYGALCCFEIAQRDNEYQRKATLTAFAEQCLNELFGFCESCFHGIHESFLQVLGIALRARFLSPYNTVWHNCDDLKADSDPSKVDVTSSHNCKCSLLGNLFRMGNVIGPLTQVRLEKILLECGKEAEFKLDLAVEYTKFIHFLFGRSYELDDEGAFEEDKVNSKLTTMEGHFFSKEKINLKVLEAGTFKNYVDILKRAIQNSSKPTSAVFYVVTTAINSIFLFLDPKIKSSEVLIQQSNIIESLLDIAMRFEAKFIYSGQVRVGLFEHEVFEREMTMGLVIEKILCQILDSTITTICRYPHDQRLRYTRSFAKTWYVKLLENRASLEKKLKDGTVSFTPTLERTISSLILNYLENDATVENLSMFFREVLPECDVPKLAGETIEGVLKCLGAARYIIVNLCLRANLMYGCTNQVSNVFESDIATVQIMTVFMKPEHLFETFVNNFFSYTANSRDFFLHFKIEDFRKEEQQAQRDFLCFLIFIMHDEVAILSNKIRTAEIYHQELTLTTHDFSTIEKFIINLAIGAYSLPYSVLKQTLVDNFINNRPEIDSIIPLVTNHDQAHQVRFKDELKGEYDPYALFKSYSLQREAAMIVAEKYGKDETFDRVSGKYYEAAPDYLKQIQRNIFQSSLSQFLSGYIQNFSDAISELLHPALKLILLNLQVTNEAITKENNQKDVLLLKVTQNYLSETFKAGLNKINQDEKYKECRLCITKIKILLKTLTGDTSESAEQDHHHQATQEEQLLKQKALDRMNKLKEQFAKKQALFADKNKPVAENETQHQEVKKDSEGAICQHCLEAVGPQSEDYGFPIYVSFTNNFYDTDKEVVFQEQDYSNMSKVTWWPVISSCHHYYHKKCYSELHAQNNMTREDRRNDFISVFETQCSFCKTLCNNFVCVNNSKSSGFFEDLSLDIQVHLFELKEKLLKKEGPPGELSYDLPTEEIFRRAYEYFIEAFHIYEEPKQLKASFELYALFLRSSSFSLDERRRLNFVESSLIRQISQHFKAQANPNFLLEYQPEALLDRELFKILTLDKASDTHNDELIRSHMTSLLEEYLTFKVIQLLATEKETSIMKIQDCVGYFKENLGFQEKVRNELIFPLKKIVLSWCLNLATSLDFSFANSDLFNLLLNSKSSSDDLLSQCGLTSSFEDRVLKALQHHSIDPASETLLNSVLNTKSLNSSSIPSVPKARKMASHVVKLPGTYAEFSNKYIKIKCSECNKFNVPIGLAICLICDKATCFMCCSLQGEKGSVNKHARKYHLGLGYFLDRLTMEQWGINTPKNGYFSTKELYIDELGQPIKRLLVNQFTIHKVDFKKYFLDLQIDQEIQETIKNQSIGKALFKGILEAQDRFPNGVI